MKTSVFSYAFPRVGSVVATVLLAATAATARADIFTIDDTEAGSVYDGLLDGFPFPPPGFAPDGTADQLTGSLAVALLSGVTEERGIVELPLASLDGVAAAEVVSATLSFNIDDVLATFGPGTTFDGTAAEALVLFAYAGNGTVDLADFGNVGGAPLAVVDTTGFGSITDATLAVSGPLSFEVDVTAAVTSRLLAGDDYLGFVFATQDHGSATSLDDLGAGGAGPEGTGGAFLPFLTVVTTSDAPPTYGKAELGCQKTIGKASSKLGASIRAALGKCLDAVLLAVSKGGDGSAATSACASGLDRDDDGSSVSKAIAKHASSVAGACEGLAPSAVGSPCDAGAADIAATIDCLAEDELSRAQSAVRSAYASSCSLLDAVALGIDHPVVCAAD